MKYRMYEKREFLTFRKVHLCAVYAELAPRFLMQFSCMERIIEREFLINGHKLVKLSANFRNVRARRA